MKKNILLLLIISLLFHNYMLKAQNMSFGITAGTNAANSHIADNEWVEYSRIYSPLVTYNINAYIAYNSNSFWGISIEPGYIQKGGVFSSEIEFTNGFEMFREGLFWESLTRQEVILEVKRNYFQVPVLFNVNLNKNISFSLGPEFSYLISSIAVSDEVVGDLSEFNDDADFEFSGMLGVNFNIIDNIDLGLRYNHGITKASEFWWTDVFGILLMPAEEYNQYLQLYLRFKINR